MVEVTFGEATLPNHPQSVNIRSGAVWRNSSRRATRFYHGGMWSPPTTPVSLTTATAVGRSGSDRVSIVTLTTQIITIGDGDDNVTRVVALPTRIR